MWRASSICELNSHLSAVDILYSFCIYLEILVSQLDYLCYLPNIWDAFYTFYLSRKWKTFVALKNSNKGVDAWRDPPTCHGHGKIATKSSHIPQEVQNKWNTYSPLTMFYYLFIAAFQVDKESPLDCHLISTYSTLPSLEVLKSVAVLHDEVQCASGEVQCTSREAYIFTEAYLSSAPNHALRYWKCTAFGSGLPCKF